jgi:small subunit ribosomal protein S17e
MDQFPNQFAADNFQHNKQKVEEMTTVDSNLLRNRIAGCITRKLASKKKERSEPISE